MMMMMMRMMMMMMMIMTARMIKVGWSDNSDHEWIKRPLKSRGLILLMRHGLILPMGDDDGQ